MQIIPAPEHILDSDLVLDDSQVADDASPSSVDIIVGSNGHSLDTEGAILICNSVSYRGL